MCNPCANWYFETAETWGLRYDGIGVSSKYRQILFGRPAFTSSINNLLLLIGD